jgi:pyruvate,orthophosphate dikinase
MFFEETRIRTVREMILAEDEQARRAALAKLLPMQRADFVELFEIMKGLPVTIRLLDPPLHEFLPHTQGEVEEVARVMGTDPRKLADRARDLAEFNPMLGFRGVRIAIAYPEIAEMQARALFEAAIEAGKRTGEQVGLEVMVPLIVTKMEFDLIKARIDATAVSVMKETGGKLNYSVGTMIELPRACLLAGEIAETAEFFSFGTNDLTQTTFGISRDDAASFLGTYIAKGILPVDPFITVDRSGVGELVKIGVARGRKTRPDIKVGICGEHGGDPASVAFCHETACHEIGLDYVSCSPYRVPIARLAAAQADKIKLTKAYYRIDCFQRRMKIDTVIGYAASGDVVAHEKGYGSWSQVPPDSVANALVRFACGDTSDAYDFGDHGAEYAARATLHFQDSDAPFVP